MHIKSKLELNVFQISSLAICTLLSLLNSVRSAIFFIVAVGLSIIVSSFICAIFNKETNKHTKIILYAIISSLIVIVCNIIFEGSGIYVDVDNSCFAILSTLILSIYSVYIEPNQTPLKDLINIIKLLSSFIIIILIYSVFKEFLSFGTIFDIKLFVFDGYEFCKTLIFDFLLIGLICSSGCKFIGIFRDYSNQKKLTLNKYKYKIKTEKLFLYDTYRRKKLLTSNVQINHISIGDDGKINENNENESEIVQKSELKHKPKNNAKLKVSKEAKVEQMFDRKNKKLEDKK